MLRPRASSPLSVHGPSARTCAFPTLLRIEGYDVVQLPVNHRPRRAGRSKYGISNRVFSSFADLLAVRWMKKRRLGYKVVRHEP